MKDPNELTDEERLLILNILKQISHQYNDYSDVRVSNVIFAQAVAKQPWLPEDCYCVPRNTMDLMDGCCEYGFLKKVGGGKYEITKLGLEYLRKN